VGVEVGVVTAVAAEEEEVVVVAEEEEVLVVEEAEAHPHPPRPRPPFRVALAVNRRLPLAMAEEGGQRSLQELYLQDEAKEVGLGVKYTVLRRSRRC
jgi:hypothetical protein